MQGLNNEPEDVLNMKELRSRGGYSAIVGPTVVAMCCTPTGTLYFGTRWNEIYQVTTIDLTQFA